MCTPTQLAAIERIREAASRSTYASTDPEHLAQIVVLSCRVDETGRIRRYVCRNQVDQFTEWILTWQVDGCRIRCLRARHACCINKNLNSIC